MKRTVLVLPFFVLWFAEPSPGQARRTPAGSVGQLVARTPTQMMLRTRVADLSWDEVPLAEVLDWLRSQSPTNDRVNVIPRWRALNGAGVDRQTTVTLELSQVTVAQVLEEVLDQIAGNDPLVYLSQGNTLRITTRSDLRKRLITRTYDVAEIVMQSRGLRVQPMFFSGQQIDFGAATATPGAGIGSAGGTMSIGASLFGDPADDNDDNDDVTDEDLAERIIETIVKTVAPESWRVNGGLGTLSVIDGVLIVRNSADVHQMLGGSFRLNGQPPIK